LIKYGSQISEFFCRFLGNSQKPDGTGFYSRIGVHACPPDKPHENHEPARLLERLLEFLERQVKDVMVPRMEVTAIDASTPFDEIVGVVESTRYSRFPVYRGVLDNVIGILHGKDLMP